MRKHVQRLLTLGLLASAVPLAQAAPTQVFCPNTEITTDREFSVTTDPGTATCLASGTGNISGNGDAINALGYVTLDKSDDATSGLFPNALTGSSNGNPNGLTAGLSGTFSFTAPSGFFDFVVGFKSGEGRLDPDWVAFLLPAGVRSGSWTISGQQELSHVNLYAKRGDPRQSVPEPSTLVTVALGLALLRRAARRG
jgi:hypothetical protein